MALNASMLYMPRFVIVNVPPATSAGFSRPLRARSVRSLRWAAMSARAAVLSALGMTAPTTPSCNRHRDADVHVGFSRMHCRRPSWHSSSDAWPATLAVSATRRSVWVTRFRSLSFSRLRSGRSHPHRAQEKSEELASSSASCAPPSVGRWRSSRTAAAVARQRLRSEGLPRPSERLRS